MSFVDAVRTCFSKYADFSGRARRAEYWWWALFNLLVTAVLVVLMYMLGSTLVLIPLLGIVLPGLAVTVRRLHDTSRSGWWYFVSLVPFVGGIMLQLLCCLDSHPDNQYGPNPKNHTQGRATTPHPA